MDQPTDVVDRQLQAYNSLDFELFSSCYHRNISSYDLESGARLNHLCGEHFFAHYKEKFATNSQIHCRVTQRIVHDDLVVDKEYITACKGANHHEMVIYMIEDGLIIKMWFSKEIGEKK